MRSERAPEHIRDCFITAVYTYYYWSKTDRSWRPPAVTRATKYKSKQSSLSAVCGLCWNCADILPSHAFDMLIESGISLSDQTYGAAARGMRAALGVPSPKSRETSPRSANVPFRERITCSIEEAIEASGLGRASFCKLMKEGDLAYTMHDDSPLIRVQSLMALLGETACVPQT